MEIEVRRIDGSSERTFVPVTTSVHYIDTLMHGEHGIVEVTILSVTIAGDI